MSLPDLLDQLDPRPGVRGRQFERLCAWYLSNAPEYRDRFRRVWLWSDWPGAWAADAGIDLVAEERDGGLWAIQAKAYDPYYAIKKTDVDSFLSESSRPQFTYRLLMATTDHLGATARRTLDAQREPVGYLLRSQLELAEVSWPTSPGELNPQRPAPKKPFPHVREAIGAVVAGFADCDRGQLVMACGTGKTLAAMWIAEGLESKRTLVLLPSLSLLAQTLREWTANASSRFDDYLAVCSDETVAERDELVQHTSELGLPVTTDADVIAAFLRRRGRRVVFATYQSSPQIAAAQTGRVPSFDLAVADEAHRCAGRVGSEFTTILDSERIQAKRRLFMTATPRFYTARVRSEAGQLDVDIASMDDERIFGPVLHRLTFGEAIQRDLLSDYQVVVVGVDDDMYRAWAKRGEFVTCDGSRVTDARSLAGQIALVKSIRKYALRRIISFHSRVNAARKFSNELPSVIRWMPAQARPSGPIWSEHVSGAMTSGHRDRLLLRFRKLAPKERGLLSNARCLGEGVDVPSIDGIAFIDPRRSTIDIVQALGRAIRKSAEKRLGTIVLPVFLSAIEDPDEALNESAFQHVWDVLKALRAHDEALGEELDELRRRLGARRAPVRRPRRIILDVPRTVGAEFARAFDVRLVEQTTASWQFYFGLLQRFIEREGHPRVPQGHREDGYPLGNWVNNQRAFRARGELGLDRERQLDGLSGWTWDVLQAWWEEGFAYLQQFVEREGNAKVSGSHRENGFRLGGWLHVQRQAFRKGMLDPQRRGRLESLPGWSWRPDEDAWEEGFNHLRAFVEREGHAWIAGDAREDGYGLGTWVGNQRARRARGELDADRERQLEGLSGWTWDVPQARWEEGFAYLQQFVEREGHAKVPGSHREDGYRLHRWLNRQRRAYREGTLDLHRRRGLESLPGWSWKPDEDAWEDGFNNLRAFAEREGHARVSRGHREGSYRLGQWAGVQRQAYQKGTLVIGRVRRLEALPGWIWETRETAWEEGLARLQQFVEREGHAKIPSDHSEDGYRLGEWLNIQREANRQETLDPRRRGQLESLPGWSWRPREDAWEEGFNHLRTFVEREGHARVSQAHREGHYRLGSWVARQRRLKQNGRLSDERAHRLESLPGWVWDARRLTPAR